MRDLGHQQDIEYASYELPPTPRATAVTSGVQARVAVDLESVVLNRIRTSATPVTADTVYRSLPPQMNAKRHRVMQLIDQLVESGAVLRKRAGGTHVHTAL
ncbi:BlaI/MecI/CopY family transcriptional regulator [Rhodococcus pyridinivorans]|uniref:BlaI/MecI/CopY family transcriptional regulator n=1 Tax=Rhodococcus pyridinivorans TaxID=103816 RepID=UPI002283FDE5|nr:BlaI/MecI/CopY family transcriptional regulator [Rhodococcus pyridinivorans]WAL46801.1 BlaI/MecI/CopY family transcriptional regulator [Rhodococcus pyridinivorans]